MPPSSPISQQPTFGKSSSTSGGAGADRPGPPVPTYDGNCYRALEAGEDPLNAIPPQWRPPKTPVDRPVAALTCPKGHLAGVRDRRCGQGCRRRNRWEPWFGVDRCLGWSGQVQAAQELRARRRLGVRQSRPGIGKKPAEPANPRNLKPRGELCLAATVYETIVMVGSELDVVHGLLGCERDETVPRIACAVLAQQGRGGADVRPSVPDLRHPGPA